MLRAAMQFLQSLHDAQGWHGAAQMRNLTRLQDGFGAIDFEDDLEPSMPLGAAAGARHLPVPDQRRALCRAATLTLVPQLLQDALGRASAPVAAEVRSVGAKLVRAERVLGWLAPYLGRDGPALSRHRAKPSATCSHACGTCIDGALRRWSRYISGRGH